MEFLRGREDGVVFGAQGVNAYVKEPRFAPSQRVAGVLVMAPPELIASKVRSYYRRRAQPKSFTDRRDIAVLLLQFPELKQSSGPVADVLQATGAEPGILTAWQQLVAEEIQPPDADDEF